MLKKNCLSIIKTAGLYMLVLALLCFFRFIPVQAETSSDYWTPWVTKTTTNSATINWRGQKDGRGLIEYAKSSYYLKHQEFERTIASHITAQYQHIQLPGLEPDTSYTYRVRPLGNEYGFGIRTFQTMPVSGPFTFVVISDSQEGHHYDETKRFKYVAEGIAKEPDVLFILDCGDYARFDDEQRWAIFFQVADGMLSKSAIFPVIGNHEYHDINGSSNPPTNADNFHSAFDMPLNYSFDCAGIRFVILNTPDPNTANYDDPQTSAALALSQESWLEGQLDNTMLGTFTIHHHPIWNDGRTTINANLESWETLYHAYPISANFAGHTHNYQRFLVQGIPYFIVGNAGGPFSDLSGIDPPEYEHGTTRQLGYLKVCVDPANNKATAQEIFVASVEANDSSKTPQVYDTPVVEETVTFQLKPSGISSSEDDDHDNNCFISTISLSPSD